MIRFLSIIIFVCPVNAYAYLDPVTGSIVLQALIGGIVTAIFFIKLYWQKLIALFKRVLGKGQGAEDDKK